MTTAIEKPRAEKREMTDSRDFSSRVLQELVNEGYIQKEKGGFLFADTDKIKQDPERVFDRIRNQKYYKKERPAGVSGYRESLQLSFLGTGILSEENKEKPKPLFYEPAVAEEAFDIIAIKNSKFLIAPWEMPVASYDSAKHFARNGESLNLRESSVALLVYHPDFGDGYRNLDGKLMVRWKTKENGFYPISSDWFIKDQGLTFGSPYKKSMYSPRSVVNEIECPNLIESGLATPEDFGILSTGILGARFRALKNVDTRGNVMIRGVQYYIGRAKEFLGARVVELAPGLAGIIEDAEDEMKLSYIFDLSDRGDPKLKTHSVSKSGIEAYRADKETTNLREFKPEEIGLDPESETLLDLNDLVDFSNELSREAGVNLSVIDFPRQNAIKNAVDYFQGDEAKIFEFAKKYGIEGVQSFLSSAYWPEAMKSITEGSERMDPAACMEVFQKYSGIVRTIKDIQGFLDENLSGEDPVDYGLLQRIEKKLLVKGKEVLVQFFREDSAEDMASVAERLDDIRSDLMVFGGVFSEMKAGGEDIDLEDFEKVGIESVDASKISESDKREMVRIFSGNWQTYPGFHDRLLESFKETFEGGSKFYVVRYDSEILGFMRIEPSGEQNLVYAGSLNIRKSTRGMKIGEALLRKVLDKEAQKNVIKATAYPKLEIASRYIGDFGFAVTGMIEDYDGMGSSFFEMTRDDEANEKLKYFKKPTEEIARDYKGNSMEAGDSSVILIFNLEAGYDEFLKTSTGFLGEGYVMSAFRVDPENSDRRYLVFEKS